VAFLVSAWLYHQHGITGSACFGAGLEATLLLGSLAYLAIESGQADTPPPSTQAAAAKPFAHKRMHPFAAAAHLHLPDDTTAAAAQAEAGLGATLLVLQLSMSLSIHSQQMSRSGSLHLSRGGSLGLSFISKQASLFPEGIPEDIPEEESTQPLNGGGDTGEHTPRGV
jgi:hypothetical protein